MDPRLVQQILNRLNVEEVHYQALSMAYPRPMEADGGPRFGMGLLVVRQDESRPEAVAQCAQRALQERIRQGIAMMSNDPPEALWVDFPPTLSNQSLSYDAATDSVYASTLSTATCVFGPSWKHIGVEQQGYNYIAQQHLAL